MIIFQCFEGLVVSNDDETGPEKSDARGKYIFIPG